MSTADEEKIYFKVSVRIINKPTNKPHWLRVGSGVELPDGSIACKIESIPLDWDGQFRLFESGEDSPESEAG